MGGGAPATAFTPAEQGVEYRFTGTNRLTHDPSPADRAAADDAGARAVLERQKAFRADPPGLIQLAEELQQTFLRAGEKAPRTRRAAAIELLRIYGKLKEFESSNTPRGPGGSLQYKAPPGMRLQPWTRKHPRVVADIPPFSAQNVRAWEAAAAAAGPPLPSPAPPRVTSPPPKPKPVVKKPPDRFGIQIIKLPGMTLKSKGGQIQILASILRVLSRQALSGAEAYAVASKLDFSKYWVLDFEDTVEHATKVFEGYSPGNPHTFRLKNDLLQDLTRFTSLPLYPEQRVLRAVNDFSSEYFPDFTNDERLWYVIERIKHSPNRDPNSGHKPGEVVSADGVMFVGPEPSSSLYWTPNGRLYLVPQKSLREQQIDAVIKGFVDARGGVILGYGVIVVGVAAYAAPAVVGAFASALAPLFTTVTGLSESVLYSRFVVWLGMNWEVVTLKAAAIGAGVSLAVKIANFDPAAWYAEFRKDPKKALGDAIYLIAETVQDYFELRQGFGPGTPRLTPAPGTPRGPAIDDQPAPLPTPSRPAGPTRQPTTVTTKPDVAAAPANRLASRPQPDLPYTDELAARRSRMTNPSTASAADQPATAVQVQPARILKRTGTGSVDVIEDDQTAGITTVATAGPRQTTPSKPTWGVVKGSGGGGKATPSRGGSSGTSTMTDVAHKASQSRGLDPPPPQFIPGMTRKLGLSMRERDFLIDNAETYRRQMRDHAHITDPNKQSTAAHRETETEVLGRWQGAVKEKAAITGVSGPGTVGPRQADTALRLSDPAPDKPARDIVVDFKKTAFVEKPSRTLYTYGYDMLNKIESDQIQAYEVAARQLGLRVFIINERGEVFTPDPDRTRGWVKVAGASR